MPSTTENPAAAPPDRIESLDLIRGVAVLGILAINIGGFAGPSVESISPNYMGPVSPADEWTFAAMFLLFEGKMRALFTLLFGASLLLFVERSEAAGRPGLALQMRRLLWLGLFGYLHYILFWWGDILFYYALAGLLALPFCRLKPAMLAVIGLATFTLWQAHGMVERAPFVAAKSRVLDGTATAADAEQRTKRIGEFIEMAEREELGVRAGFLEHARMKLADDPFSPLLGAIEYLGETLPLILIGMALYGSGFFSSGWSRAALKRTVLVGVGLGGATTLAILGWVMPDHYPQSTMAMLIHYGASTPHLLMAMGYAAALVMATPRLLATRIGARIEAAGKMAFSNYLGMTVLMTFIFNGWGLGLFDRYGPLAQLPFVLLGWALMLLWSKWWLARYRRGPLEWLWRSLVEWRVLANAR